MINVPIAAVPNQTFTIRLDGARYDFEIREGGGEGEDADVMAVTVSRDGLKLLDGHRAVAGALLLPYEYLGPGNFLFLTEDDELPAWASFGVTQSLVYLDAEEVEVAVEASSAAIPSPVFSVFPVFAPTSVYDFTTAIPAGFTFTRAGPATYTNAAGLLVTAAANAPRFDYANGVAQGLLMEQSRGNFILSSQDFQAASWTPLAVTVTPAAKVAPDGTNTGTLLGGVTSGTNSLSTTTTGHVADTKLEPSVWMARVPGADVGAILLLNPQDATRGNWRVDVSKLSLGFERISRGHPAVTVIADFSATAAGTSGIRFRGTAGNRAPVSVYIWGAQLEQGASPFNPLPSSYIATAGAVVVRATDRLFGTIPALSATPTVRLTIRSAARANAFALSFSTGTIDNAIVFVARQEDNSVRWRATRNGVVGTPLAPTPRVPALPQVGRYSTVAAWSSYNVALAWAGSTPSTETMFPMLPAGALTRVDVGADAGGGSPFNGHFLRFELSTRQYPPVSLPALSA